MSLNDYKDFEELMPLFDSIFELNIEKSSSLEIVRKSIENEDTLLGITDLLYEIPNYSKEEAFFMYMEMQLMINDYYKTSIVIPSDMVESESITTNKSTFACYLNVILLRKAVKAKRDLLDNIIRIYFEKSTTMKGLGIKNIYIFGSVTENEYHRESDIDLVVSFEDLTYLRKRDAVDYLKRFNKEYFKRETDIQKYNDFIRFNPNISLLKIL